MLFLKRTPLIFSFLFLSCYLSFAQPALPPAYEIKSDTLTTQDIDSSYWQVLADKTNKLGFSDIINLKDQFHFVSKSNPASETRVNTYWFRYRLKNTMKNNAAISLSSQADLCDFYVSDSIGTIRHYITGDNSSWSKKNGFKNANAIPLIFGPGQEMLIYQRRFNANPERLKSSVKIRLYATRMLEKSELQEYEAGYVERSFIYDAFLSGLFFLAAIFNFLIYWQVKDKVYLYFSLFLFCISILYQPALLNISIIDNYHLLNFFASIETLWMVFFLLFVRRYFDLATTHPKWNKFLVAASFIYTIIILLSAVPYDLENDTIFRKTRQIILLAYFIFLIFSTILGIRKRGPSRKIFMIAMFPFILTLASITLIIFIFFRNESFDSNIIQYLMGASIAWGVIVFSSFLFKRYGEQQKQIMQDQLNKEKERNEFIAEQKSELEKQVASRTSDLKQSLEDLKATQSQLIQSEKMASLGELTAGIAHEIQNPLNFVNNFSELNRELLSEMKDEIEFGNMTNVNALADDIISNEAKINHHGKRADAIVKGMLQHSRSSNGQKESTGINALCAEYLKLCYHGLRAKDKSFNATLKTNFDESIGNINVIPEDIGRVMLNLISNAFYAVSEKKKQNLANYEPTVTVKTAQTPPLGGRGVEISVTDNGPGIPKNIVDKIFQPFFTTKPTGQGTGLGLSLAYDIIKAHGGKLKVETTENEGAAFIIEFPIV